MSMDFRGDPSAALLEVLDPEQNNTFNDHYLDMDYDLSRIMFICTANTLQGIPPALEDRLEIIRIAGYTELEKIAIADRYLIPKQRLENGLAEVQIEFGEVAVRTIIQQYTREAGVRQLEREIASICRKLAKEVVQQGGESRFRVTPARIKKSLGVPKFRSKIREEQDEVGMATGLAWTQMGGEILHIEVSTMPGKGKLTITGKLGDVMQESAQAAMSYVRARAESWGLAPDFYSTIDTHIHVPEGAMPKDGPSAGITMATSLVSALTRIPVRHDIAMTGEITLRGRVLPIGGLKEKALAAHRAEIREVIIPKENEKELEEVPKVVARQLKFHVVEHMDEVLKHALVLDSPDEFFRQAKGSDRGKASLSAEESETNEAGSPPATSSVQ
jgi:ATP-dependent Lon protease